MQLHLKLLLSVQLFFFWNNLPVTWQLVELELNLVEDLQRIRNCSQKKETKTSMDKEEKKPQNKKLLTRPLKENSELFKMI